MNLATNAINYTPNGQVEMTFRIEDGDHWALIVSDTGPGIAAEECARIFEEFYRIPATTAGQPGTALGMAITQQLTHLLSGEIHLGEQGRKSPPAPPAPGAGLRQHRRSVALTSVSGSAFA